MCKSSLLCAGVQTDDIQSRIVIPSRNLLAVVVEGGERRLHLGLFGMPLDCEEQESERERESNAQGFVYVYILRLILK
jgi:hypothetical protein